MLEMYVSRKLRNVDTDCLKILTYVLLNKQLIGDINRGTASRNKVNNVNLWFHTGHEHLVSW